MQGQALRVQVSSQPSTCFTGQESGTHLDSGLCFSQDVITEVTVTVGSSPASHKINNLSKLDPISPYLSKTLDWVSVACVRMPELLHKDHPFAC